MSLSNEQRAHDLAIASLPFMREQIEIAISKGEDVVFDGYKQYKNLYEHYLVPISRDFPNQD